MQTKHIFLICLLAISVIAFQGCDYVKSYDKPHLELSDGPPYKLSITNFDWSYGTAEINKFNGDFDKLDEKVFDLLQDKSGFCQVYLEQRNVDKYGNNNSSMQLIGHINIDELAKYRDWQYWQKDGGLKKMIYATMVQLDAHRNDSTAVLRDTTSHQSPTVNEHSYTPTPVSRRVFTFSESMLYPTEDDRKDLDTTRFNVNGTIEDVNFTNGLMQYKQKPNC